jgi:PAS domain S-box-containing protein
MTLNSQSNDSLLKKLERLQHEYDSLKARYDQIISGHANAESQREKQLSFTQALNKIADVIISNNNSEEILESTNRILAETLKVDRAVIYDVSLVKNRIIGLCEWLKQGHADIAPTIGSYPIEMFLGPISAIKKSEQFIISHFNEVNNYFTDDNLIKLLHSQINIKSLLWYPFAFDDHGYYVFALNQILTLRKWTQEDIGFIESVAKQVSFALIKMRLRESETKYRQLIESANEAIVVIKDGLLCLNNPITCTMTGYSENEIGTIPFQLFIHPDDREHIVDNHLKRLNGENIPSNYVFRLLHKDGSTRFAHMNAVLINWEGSPATLNFLTDITDLKIAEEALVQSSKKWEAIIEASPDGIGMISLNGKIQLISEKLVNMHGYSTDQMNIILGKSIFDYIDPADHQLLIENTRKLLEGENGKRITEYRALKMDGSKFYIDINASVLHNSNGSPSSILYVERDITERKIADEEIKISNQELSKLNSEKDKLFSIIAHDLRSPFYGLLGLTEALDADNQTMSPTEIQKYSSLMHESVVTIYTLLENLLEWAQFQKGTIGFIPDDIFLVQLFAQSINSVSQRARHKGIEIINEISGSLQIFADDIMVNSVLRNLLSNAVKFTNRGGKITCKSRVTDDGLVEISVSDTGVGIPPTIKDRLFRLGEKVSTPGTENEPSTGLGLLLCKEFIEKHGGKIWVVSEKGTGSTFYFTLPKAQ